MSTERVVGGAASRFARPAVLGVEPYVWEMSSQEVAARYGVDPAQVVRFDTNTSPLPPPSLRRGLRAIEADPAVNEYYDSRYASLTRAISGYLAVPPEWVVVGAGADEILDIICRTFVDPGDVVILPQPTYAVYRIDAESMGGVVRAMPVNPGLQFDIDAIIAAGDGAKLVFLCNPNNPTGLCVRTADVERLARSLECMLVIDEAYAEFAGESLLPLLPGFPRMIVVRTLSKAFSLAGARVGFAVCAPDIVGLFHRIRPPQSVSYMSVVLAEHALLDEDAMRANVEALLRERIWLSTALNELGLQVYPSRTNFVLARASSTQIVALMQAASLRQGMVLRTFAAGSPLESCVRVAARSRADNERLVWTLRAALAL